MRYITFLILFILIIPIPPTARAQDERYRVEVVVLTHLHHAAEPREMKWIADYSAATDFLTPVPPPQALPEECQPEEAADGAEAGEPRGQTLDGQVPDAQSLDGQTPGDNPFGSQAGAEEVVPEPDPNALVHVEEMSDTMQEAWRRLRLSAPFRPEQYLSWEQGSNEPFPSLRLHDLVVVDTDDPYARERFEQEQAAATDDLSDTGQPGTEKPVVADAGAPDDPCQAAALAAQEVEPALPDPTLFYRLDGTIKLRRSRFLHFELDLQLREALFEQDSLAAAEGSLLAREPEVPAEPDPAQAWALQAGDVVEEFVEPARPSTFLIHALKQSRQIKTGRMEYFDSPVLGVLALISKVEIAEEPVAESP